MENQLKRFWGMAICAIALALPCTQSLRAQANPTTHNLALSGVMETVDAHGRRVFVAKSAGDLPGILTLALVIGPNGAVTSGEWALTVSYIQFGPPDADGDGDASETLVQRGVFKGSVSGGSAVLVPSGFASDLSGLQLNITGATVEFAAVKSGSGSLVGASMDQQAASNGSLALTF